MARILIADEHPMTRYALRTLLQEGHHSVIGEARNGLEALSLTVGLNPDLLIIDIDLSQVSGLDVITRLRARKLSLPILGYSTQDSEHYVGRFLQEGASGFVSKHQEVEVLREAIAALLRGNSYFPSELLGSVNHRGVQEGDAERVALLSNRELSVLSLLASGYSNQEIAHELTVSEKSISTYRARMRLKLNLHSMMDLVDFARRNRLVAPARGEVPVAVGAGKEAPIWRSMVESLPAAFYIRDLEARLLYANPAHLALYQCSLDEVLGTRTTEVNWYTPDDAQNMLNFLLRQIADEASFSKDIELSIHGRRRVLHHWGTPYRDADGHMLGMICCSTDISERYQQINELGRRTDAAERANRQVAEWLRYSLQALEGGMQALGAGLNAPGTVDAHAMGARLAALQTQLSDLRDALGDAPLALNESLLSVAELVDALAQQLQTQASQRHLMFKHDGLAKVLGWLRVDRQRLLNAWQHLGLYVLDRTPQGWLHLSITALPASVRISLHGAPPAREGRRAYSLAELTEAVAPAEDDLHLRIARRLLVALGGELQLSHVPEHGVIAAVDLPLAAADTSA